MLHDDKNAVMLDMVPPGYVTTQVHRQTLIHSKINRGGGLVVIYRDNFKVKRHPCSVSFKPSSFEVQICNVAPGTVSFGLDNIHHPPANSRSVFFDELADLLSLLNDRVSSDRFVVCDDLNSSLLSQINDDDLLTVLEIHGLEQFVLDPSRESQTSSSLPDPVIGVRNSPFISNVTVCSDFDVLDLRLVKWKL